MTKDINKSAKKNAANKKKFLKILHRIIDRYIVQRDELVKDKQ